MNDQAGEREYPRFKCLICKKGANELDSPHYLERVSATGKGAPALWLCTEHLNQQLAAEREWSQHLRIQLAAEVKKVNSAQQEMGEQMELNDQLKEQLAAAEDLQVKTAVRAERAQIQLAAEREKYIVSEGLLIHANKELVKQLAAEREVGGNTAIALAQQITKLEDQLAAAVEALRQIDELPKDEETATVFEIAAAALEKIGGKCGSKMDKNNGLL